MIGIIYKYTSPSNKSYIGQTINEKIRMKRHKYAAKHHTEKGRSKFYRAIRKYGWDNFTYEVLFTIDNDDKKRVKEKLDFMERYYIRKFDSYNNGYNMTLGGDCGMKGINLTDEWKNHISESHKGMKYSDEFKQTLSEAHKGKPSWNKGLKGTKSGIKGKHRVYDNPEHTKYHYE